MCQCMNKKKHNFTFIRNIMEIGYKIKLEKSQSKYHKLSHWKKDNENFIK